jgi:hypothetical protein
MGVPVGESIRSSSHPKKKSSISALGRTRLATKLFFQKYGSASRLQHTIFHFTDWSQPFQIMTAQDRRWHILYSSTASTTSAPGPFPYAFTLGSLEIERP